MVERLGARPVPVNLPVGAEDGYRGVIDLLAMNMRMPNEEDLGATFTVTEIPAELARRRPRWRGSS